MSTSTLSPSTTLNAIIALHQNYAKISGPAETLQIIDLVEQALHLNTGTRARKSVPAGPDQQMSPQGIPMTTKL